MRNALIEVLLCLLAFFGLDYVAERLFGSTPDDRDFTRDE